MTEVSGSRRVNNSTFSEKAVLSLEETSNSPLSLPFSSSRESREIGEAHADADNLGTLEY